MSDSLDAADELLEGKEEQKVVDAGELKLSDVGKAVDGLSDVEAEELAAKLDDTTANAASAKDKIRRAANWLIDFGIERLT